MGVLLPTIIALSAAASAHKGPPQPATTAAILGGVRACVGATADTGGFDKRFIGWTPAFATASRPATAVKGKQAARPVAAPTGGGRIYFRDNVMLVARPGASGGCIVDAKAEAGFSRSAFYADLSQELGVPVPLEPAPSVIALANGERMIVAADSKSLQIKLIVLGPNSK